MREELPRDTGRYLLNHYRRDMASLCALLDELDLAFFQPSRHQQHGTGHKQHCGGEPGVFEH